MSRTIEIDLLDASSVDAAIREIQEYAKWVQTKTDELRERVAEEIRRDADILFSTGGEELAGADNLFGRSGVEVRVEPGGENTTQVIAEGEEAVYIEFGAGVHFNGSVGSYPNPLAKNLDFISAIGTYGQGHGSQDMWVYKDSHGEKQWTYGTPADMPMYKAVKSATDDIERIARGVFSDT